MTPDQILKYLLNKAEQEKLKGDRHEKGSFEWIMHQGSRLAYLEAHNQLREEFK